jgi:tRNA (mo5U34)-methyltransferase
MSDGLAERVAAHPLWYHTIDLGNGVVTPGWFDLRPVLDRLPWPDLAGKRCLDVGTYDGHLAFELERRGAGEVLATDIASHHDWDWLPRHRETGVAVFDAMAGEKGRGFEIAREALGSEVRRELISIYDLCPERVGVFDVVVCGALLLHLRDPFRALAALRSVCRGRLLSIEQIDVVLSAVHRRRPLLDVVGSDGQWTVPNAAGHSAMLRVAGFDEITSVGPFAIPLGPSYPDRVGQAPRARLRTRLRQGVQDRLLGARGVPARAVLGR